MKKLFAPLLLALSSLLLGGCLTNTEVITRGLHIELVRLERTPAGETRVTWRVINPNVVAYVLPKASLRVSLDGAPVGTATDESRFGVPSLNQVERTSVLVPNGPAAGEIIARAVEKGSASYDLDSTFWVLLVEDKMEKFTLTHSGTLPVTGK